MDKNTKSLQNEAGTTGLRLFYKSNISELTEVNPSFDAGVMRIAYVGLNRNNSIISKSVFKDNIKTLFNIPIVAHYHMAKTAKEDKLGGHDIAFIERDGELQKINITSPLGIVPESAKYWFEQKEEDGIIHDYLCCDVLIWKRQPVYQYVKSHKGNINESMEIEVTDGYIDDDGHFRINKFFFTALCLLDDDIEPCFESASMSANFSKLSFDAQYNQMIDELRQSNKISEEGGESMKQVANTNEAPNEGLTSENTETAVTTCENSGTEATQDSEHHTEEFNVTESSADVIAATTEDVVSDDNDINDGENFQLIMEIERKLSSYFRGFKRVLDHVAGYDMRKYVFVDYDTETQTVYFEEYTESETKEQRGHYVLYGAHCQVEDENVTVDFSQKFKAKYEITRIDAGDEEPSVCDVFSGIIDNCDVVVNELNEKLREAESKYSKLTNEIEEKAKNAVFEKFNAKLGDDKDFADLKENASKYSKNEIETLCFAMIGKKIASETQDEDEKDSNHSTVVTHTAFSKDGSDGEGDGTTKKLYGGLMSVEIK